VGIKIPWFGGEGLLGDQPRRDFFISSVAGHCMKGRPLQSSLSDGHILLVCI